MIKFVKAATLVLVVSVLAYFFCVDGIIKSLLEREGSRTFQASLTIEKATFHLLPTSLQLASVQLVDTAQPERNLIQAERIAVPLSLGDLLAHRLIIETMEVRGVRFNHPRAGFENTSPSPQVSATQSPRLREVLERAQQTLNHPLASNTVDANTSIAGALLADEFNPLLDRIGATLRALTANAPNHSDWQMIAHHIDIDGAIDFGSRALQFVGTLDNVTPQPAAFDAVTQFNLHNADSEPAKFSAQGMLDRRKLAQMSLRFDLSGLPVTQWSLSRDPELDIELASAVIDVQSLLALVGNQLDLNVLLRCQRAQLTIRAGTHSIAQAAAEAWRGIDAFDIQLQASGDLQNPRTTLSSSLDAPLAAALRQRQASFAPPASTFPATP